MIQTTLSKVGNSLALLLPKSLRQQASIDADQTLRVESPRKGVVVITSIIAPEERTARLREAQKRIEARAGEIAPWPDGLNADDLLATAKEEAADELFLS